MTEHESTEIVAAQTDMAAWQKAAGISSFAGDPWYRDLLQQLLGDHFDEVEDRLQAVAASTGSELDSLVREDNRDENLPQVRRHDSLGRRIEQVVFHPAHHEIGRVFWASGVLQVLAEPGNQVLSGAIAYLLDQHGEAGHACPVACTAGAILLLQRLGSQEQQQQYLPSLLATEYDRRLHAAQFVTEIQGGSDVGANSCVAVPDPEQPGHYRLWGEKWFCSVADAGLFVVSARLQGAAAGTSGLGLFLVPRLIDGEPNRFQLRRLKYKLGTRSMPTGEIELEGSLAEPIGPIDRGFPNLVGIVLDTSRVHNAVAASGICRRAFVEAHSFAGHRRAFGQPIISYPAVQEILATMKLRTVTALATTLRVLDMGDRLDQDTDDHELQAARRIAVMINKYWTARSATANARDGIEILGGNGTIEELSVLPRLYRDAIVIESWEGTHNTLCAQVLRDMVTRSLHQPWLANIGHEIEALSHPSVASAAEVGRQLLAEVSERIDRLVASPAMVQAAHIRTVVEQMCRLTDWIVLLSLAQWQAEHGIKGETADALELYRLRWIERADPQQTHELIDLHQRLSAAL